MSGSVTVWSDASIPANVSVGNDCSLEVRRETFERFRSTREPAVRLGDRVTVYTWTQFNLEPSAMVEVGDDSVLVGALLMCAECISIGKRVIISYNVTIADSDFHPHDPELRKQDAIANAPANSGKERPPLVSRPVTIDDDVQIGIGAIILKGVHIGAGARVAAGAVVTRDVPAGAYVAGNPAQVVPAEGATR